MKWLTFDRGWTLAMALLAVGGWAAVTTRSDHDQSDQFSALSLQLKDLSGDIKELSGADNAKTRALDKIESRLIALEAHDKILDERLELNRIQLEKVNVDLAVAAAKRGGS